MNFFNKLYCRGFQFCFKIALPFLPYRKPKIYESNENIKDILAEAKVDSVLIVTSKSLSKSFAMEDIKNILDNKKIRYEIYDNCMPNPTIECVEQAKELYLSNDLQAIIAFGGGSAMDLAKIVGARVVRPNKSVSKMKGLLKIRKKLPPLIAIPTTAGTGSEVTIAAVITDEKTHHKYPINDFNLVYHYAVLDYKNTISLPKSITATTGMDALTHAVEAFISKTRTKETKKMSLEATKLIVENLKECYDNPTNHIARKNMLYASYCAGVAFTKAYVGYVHAIAHSLGGKYNIAHGLANAVILPIVLEEYGKRIYKRIKELAVYCDLANKEDSPKDATYKFIDWIYNINLQMNIPYSLNMIEEKDIKELSHIASKEANPLYPVPKLLSARELEKIYYILKNKER